MEEEIILDRRSCDHCVILSKIRQGEARVEVGSEVWKWIATTLSGALIASMAFWFTSQGNLVTHGDMESFIQKNSPYAIDRQVVVNTLADLKEGQKAMWDQINIIKEMQTKIILAVEFKGNRNLK